MRLIDADALKIENVDWEHGCTVVDYALGVIKSVANAPTIDAEPVRHGRWENYGGVDWRCTSCNVYHTFDEYGDLHPKYDCGYYYCPNCGAKMDLEVIKAE